MYEICALLARKKAPKPRKPAKPAIKVGAACRVWGHDGVVIGKHEINPTWWNVRVKDKIVGFDRSQIDIIA